VEDFYELKRVLLKPGNYTLDIKFEDLNSSLKFMNWNPTF
jgi:hypothetical protein